MRGCKISAYFWDPYSNKEEEDKFQLETLETALFKAKKLE